MIKRLFLAGLALSLAACSGRPTSLSGAEYSQLSAISGKDGTYKVGKPYQIFGKWYYPEEDYSYTETGVASWYGEDFHAKYTANGERYDMNTLTAAHRTLPLPSIVRVTNLQNGRSVILRVNDRGPFAKDRIIDISKRGAQVLGFQAQGTTKVKVELLEDESKRLKATMTGEPYRPTNYAKSGASTPIKPMETKPVENYTITKAPSIKSGDYFVQAGAFANRDSAINLSSQLKKYGKTNVYTIDVDGQQFYRVRLGPFIHEMEAQITLDKLKYHGIQNAKVIQD